MTRVHAIIIDDSTGAVQRRISGPAEQLANQRVPDGHALIVDDQSEIPAEIEAPVYEGAIPNGSVQVDVAGASPTVREAPSGSRWTDQFESGRADGDVQAQLDALFEAQTGRSI